jgi:hypothetical protein
MFIRSNDHPPAQHGHCQLTAPDLVPYYSLINAKFLGVLFYIPSQPPIDHGCARGLRLQAPARRLIAACH